MRGVFFTLTAALISSVVPLQAQSSQNPAPIVVHVSPAPSSSSASHPPIENAATPDQIREYLRLSGDLDSFRIRWIAALDQDRSLGAPYWPESFWTAAKAAMEKADLLPMFITLYQHGVTKDLMQEVLDTYRSRGVANFQGSPACFKLGAADLALTKDMDQLKLEKTLEVLSRVYEEYKPQIKAARTKYLAEHPGYVDK